jgi:hypothetical protein
MRPILLLILALLSTKVLLADQVLKVSAVFGELQQPKPKDKGPQQTFVLTEKDLNDWAAFAMKSKKRLGVQSIQIKLQDRGAFHTTARINMNDVKLEGFAFRMFKSVLYGTQTLEADGLLTAQNGKARYEVQKASFNSIWVPAWLVNSVIGYLGSKQPPNIDITEEFQIPYEVKEIRVLRGKLEVIR